MPKTTESILKREGIIKYRGKLIYPESNGYFFWVMGRRYEGLQRAKWAIDAYRKPDFRPKNPKNKYTKGTFTRPDCIKQD